MGRYVVPLLVVATAGCAPATEPAMVRLTPAVVYTSGTATVSVPPDLATLTIQLSARARTPREAGENAATLANAVRDALVAVGIPADSIPTGHQWRWWSWGNQSQMAVDRYGRDTSYVTTHTFTARIRNLDLVGPAIDAALQAGAQTISNLSFSRTDNREAYLEAVEMATARARENAVAMAAASNAQIGRLLDLSTMPLNASPPVGFRLDEVVVTGAGGRSGATTIVNPQIQVSATVYARWELVR